MMHNLDKYVIRINLKTDIIEGHTREDLLQYCLGNPDEQYVAIGWSHVHKEICLATKQSCSYADFYEAVKESVKSYGGRMNHVLNLFWDVKENDLFWTRDEKGVYWICRAKGVAEQHFNEWLDIGAVVPVEAYPVGLEVPGQIKASFNRPRGGTAEQIKYDIITEYSKFIFNEKAQRQHYAVNPTPEENFIENLPDFELEELVISYLQVEKDYYLLSNSIAFNSTTVNVECELRARTVPGKAVVQVKGPKGKKLWASSYKEYVDKGFDVYLYCPDYEDDLGSEHVIRITEEELLSFATRKEAILPENITKYKNLFVSTN